ncbi:V/A-type H+-transporting ATPase subunit E [Anaerobacterium chartisolvens]|uniref:V-type proton ATPase subunit E n=1 Tax=Anaerobacterium chartisolvens TaxID=1297424 RepID=A0A369BCT8_9FIRM|nr:V-type ATP synthase subunit E [Anaerobacterium chartisolvens]RCX17484.1 V/A-type H+-transporting ATPase subunit E [Anaerobacterium chartisolvens]
MSGFEKIKDRILEEAREQARENIERAEREAEELLKASEGRARVSKENIIEKARAEAVESRKRIVAIAELEARKQKLKARQAIVNQAFEKALEGLCSMPDSQYGKVLMNMIVNLTESGEEEIVLSERDKARLGDDFINELNEEVKRRGMKGQLSLSRYSAPIKGGVILRSGNIEINSSFETLLRMNRGELEPEVFRLLF